MLEYFSGGEGSMTPLWPMLSGQVLDMGGGRGTATGATHVIDILSQPASGVIWIKGDLCDPSLYDQFSDKQFDWVYCNHTLEDLYDPFTVFRQIRRIAKRALIGVPNWTREAKIQDVRPDWEDISGWPHHFWLIGVNKRDGALEFYPKMCWFPSGDYECTTVNINVVWDGGDFPYRNIYQEYVGACHRNALLKWLEERWIP